MISEYANGFYNFSFISDYTLFLQFCEIIVMLAKQIYHKIAALSVQNTIILVIDRDKHETFALKNHEKSEHILKIRIVDKYIG